MHWSPPLREMKKNYGKLETHTNTHTSTCTYQVICLLVYATCQDQLYRTRLMDLVQPAFRWPAALKRNLKQSMRKWERKKERGDGSRAQGPGEKKFSGIFKDSHTDFPASARLPTPHTAAQTYKHTNTQTQKHTHTQIHKWFSHTDCTASQNFSAKIEVKPFDFFNFEYTGDWSTHLLLLAP